MSMDMVMTMLSIWLIHTVVGAALSAPVLWFGRKRIAWTDWDLLALVIPFCVWLLLMLSPLSSDQKSLANIGEPIYISFAMPAAALLRVALNQHLSRVANTLLVIGVLCGVAIGTFFLVPMKPE
jgi:hypothetical protein